MNDISPCEGVIFQNPEYKPLEELKLVVQHNNGTQTIAALDKYWAEKKYFLKYRSPILVDSCGREIVGAKEQWVELTDFILNDLTWLLHLPFYKFWSNIIYNTSVVNSIIIFLQEAPTFYNLEYFSHDPIVNMNFDKIRQSILVIFARLVTNKESPTEYISLSKHADLLYNEYIITIPVLMDLCQQYGRDNTKIIEKIVNSVFTLQPLYKKDLDKAVAFIILTLKDIEKRFEDCPNDSDGQAVPLSERGRESFAMSLPSLEDMLMYLLDIVSTINIFISIYPPSISNFKVEHFITKIISIYGNVIPEMYRKLGTLAFEDETIAKHVHLKQLLDITRLEILNMYRTLIYKNIEEIIEPQESASTVDIGEIVEDFMSNLMYILSEKEFVIDYQNLFPVTVDFQTLLDLYPDLDTVKYEFIVNSIFTLLDEPQPSLVTSKKKIFDPVAGPSNIQNNIINSESKIDVTAASSVKSDSQLSSLILEIKDILCDLGEGFIEKCLKHYNYNKESVINAILEDNLSAELRSLDRTLPFIPPDPEEKLAEAEAVTGMQRLNIYDNDEFDIMTRDTVDTSRIHKGKRKDKYKNLNDLLNDKSHISEMKDMYNKYSIITNEYDDEYDDTYDDQDIGSNAQDDIIELDARPFTIPRVLRKPETNYFQDDEEENDDDTSAIQGTTDHFIQDPALLRAKAEERRLSKQKSRVYHLQPNSTSENSKGQGQAKEISNDKSQQNKYKSARLCKNRQRIGAQWKRKQGMVPS